MALEKVPPVVILVSGGVVQAVISELGDEQIEGFLVVDQDALEYDRVATTWPACISWEEFEEDNPEECAAARKALGEE